ncbi:hypothetical protein H2198_008727 [Neophaeococcomyces mojaviensis]|uniref:Uncharacterized protein n=1 Tax=Neophaeococcomyces mojaviensis TaxID=3383035 RepID=A0ACC2ZWJ7_9EURO|nr:hypothetical protein H2198_008727 [Knufia sp. JES_112]
MRSTLIRRLATPVSTPPATNLTRPNTSATNKSAPASSPSSPQSGTKSLRAPNRSKSKSPPLSLEHFLLRSRVLNLYRTIIRAIYQIPDPDARKEPIDHAKGEFMRNKDVTDTAQIRYLASTGKAEWDGMRRYVEELGARAKQMREK